MCKSCNIHFFGKTCSIPGLPPYGILGGALFIAILISIRAFTKWAKRRSAVYESIPYEPVEDLESDEDHESDDDRSLTMAPAHLDSDGSDDSDDVPLIESREF